MKIAKFIFSVLLCSRELFAEWPIDSIEIQPKESSDIVLSILPLQKNEMFDDTLLAISKRLLLATDRFESVDIAGEASTRKVTIKVKPKELIDEFLWSEEMRDRKSIEAACIGRSERSDLSPDRLSDISGCLQKNIRSMGYLDAEVSVKPRGHSLEILLKKGIPYLVEAVELEGLQKVKRTIFEDLIKNKPKKIFSAMKLAEDTRAIIRKYLEEGFYFVEVFQPTFMVDSSKKTVRIHWRINENSQSNLIFSGHRKNRSRLYEYFDREQPFPKWYLDEMVDGLKAELLEEGYLAAKVSILRSIDEKGVEQIAIHTKQGPRFYLLPPEWVGVSDNQTIQEEFEKISDIGTGKPFEENTYRKAISDEFITRLVSRGYLDARAKDIDFLVLQERNKVKPTIYFYEGDRFSIRSITYEGVPAIVNEFQEWKDLKAFTKVGAYFDLVAFDRLQKELQRRLIALGYLDAGISREIKKSQSQVDITMKVATGPRYRVQRVLLRGAIKTDYRILRQELVLYPNDFYEEEKVRDSVSQILRLGIARSVDIQPIEKDVKRGTVYALVEVLESARFRFEFGPGFGTGDGLRGIVRATYANIGGRARRINLYLKGSRRLDDETLYDSNKYFRVEPIPFIQRRIGVEYFEPSLFNFRFDGRLSFIHLKEENNTFGEKNTFTGAVDYRLNRRWTFTSFYELIFSDPFNILKDGKTTLESVASKRFTGVGETVLTDYLDDSFSPTKGSRTRLEGSIYDSSLGGEVQVWQATLKQEIFYPLYTFRKGRSIGFSSSFNIGFTDSFGDTVEVPFEKRTRIGGENSVRGFDDGDIKPKLKNGQFQDGGDSFFSFMTEFNFPVIGDLDFLVFFDGGNAYGTNSDFRPWDLRFGAGPGVRLNTAVGPLKAGWGFILGRESGEPIGAFYLGVGAI